MLDPAPQLLGRQLSVVLDHRAVQYRLSARRAGSASAGTTTFRSAGAGHGKNFADMNLDADIIGYDFPDDGAQQMLGFERRGATLAKLRQEVAFAPLISLDNVSDIPS